MYVVFMKFESEDERVYNLFFFDIYFLKNLIVRIIFIILKLCFIKSGGWVFFDLKGFMGFIYFLRNYKY